MIHPENQAKMSARLGAKKIDSLLHPDGNRHRADTPALTDQVDDDSSALPELNVFYV